MFNGNRLRQARELRLLTQTELARRVGKSQAAIANIEGSFNLPSPELVAALAHHTRFPAGILFHRQTCRVSDGVFDVSCSVCDD